MARPAKPKTGYIPKGLVDHNELQDAVLSLRYSFKALGQNQAELDRQLARTRTRMLSQIMHAHTHLGSSDVREPRPPTVRSGRKQLRTRRSWLFRGDEELHAHLEVLKRAASRASLSDADDASTLTESSRSGEAASSTDDDVPGTSDEELEALADQWGVDWAIVRSEKQQRAVHYSPQARFRRTNQLLVHAMHLCPRAAEGPRTADAPRVSPEPETPVRRRQTPPRSKPVAISERLLSAPVTAWGHTRSEPARGDVARDVSSPLPSRVKSAPGRDAAAPAPPSRPRSAFTRASRSQRNSVAFATPGQRPQRPGSAQEQSRTLRGSEETSRVAESPAHRTAVRGRPASAAATRTRLSAQ